jgi:V8-like Glu-specific endopeptidase
VVRRAPILDEHRLDDDQLLSPSLDLEGERRRRWSSLPWCGARAIGTLWFVLGTNGCGDSGRADLRPSVETSTQAISGGIPSDDTEFQAVVSLGGCSGTLVHPALVVYAAHCGTAMSVVHFGSHAETPERVANVDRCRTFPGAKLGDGSDLAYCVLAEPVLDVEPERIMSGCELGDLTIGKRATIVGFGVDRDGGTYGEKRHATSRIDTIGDELTLRSGGADTCRGDSGGPVFVTRVEPDGTPARRLVGVTSAGSEAECGQGVGHYVNVTAKLDWLESSSQLDLSPCFDEGAWSPTPVCKRTTPPAPADGDEPPQENGEPSTPALLASCGNAFDATPDEVPPVVAWTAPSSTPVRYVLPVDATFTEFELAVEAIDVGWGIERVSFTLLDEQKQVVFARDDEVAPYGFSTFRLPPGTFTLEASALDFAGNAASSRVEAQVTYETVATNTPGTGCALSARGAETSNWLMPMLAFLALARQRRQKNSPGPRNKESRQGK